MCTYLDDRQNRYQAEDSVILFNIFRMVKLEPVKKALHCVWRADGVAGGAFFQNCGKGVFWIFVRIKADNPRVAEIFLAPTSAVPVLAAIFRSG